VFFSRTVIPSIPAGSIDKDPQAGKMEVAISISRSLGEMKESGVNSARVTPLPQTWSRLALFPAGDVLFCGLVRVRGCAGGTEGLEIERRREEEKLRRESPQERRRRETDLRSGDKTATISGDGPPTESTPPSLFQGGKEKEEEKREREREREKGEDGRVAATKAFITHLNLTIS